MMGEKILYRSTLGMMDDETRKAAPKKLPGLDQLLAEVLGEEQDDQTAAKFILMALRAKALKGDVQAAEVLLERGYGKVRQDVDVTTKGEKIQRLITQVEIIKTVKNEVVAPKL
jgi:hypothetical protein